MTLPSSASNSGFECALARAALLRAGGAWAYVARHVEHRAVRRVLAGLERIVAPGLGAHHAQRKVVLARWIDTLAHPHARHVLFVGAGFDGLPLALRRRHPAWRVRVVDHPATLALRRAALGEAREDTQACNVLDLARDAGRWQTLLEPRCINPLVIFEGVLMYLREPVVAAVLRGLRQHAPHAELMLSFVEPTRPDGPGFGRRAHVMRAWLGWQREPFQWRISADALAARLRAWGYTPRSWAGIAAVPDTDALDATLQCFGEGLVYATSSANVASAAASVASRSASACALETNPASNAEGARYTPRASMAWKKR